MGFPTAQACRSVFKLDYTCTINLLKLPKMWRLLMRVEKRLMVLSFQEGERLFRAHSHFDIVKGGTQGFPFICSRAHRHEEAFIT